MVGEYERAFYDSQYAMVAPLPQHYGMLNHDQIGTEHIMLGLIREDEGVAARTLESLGIRLEVVRQQLLEIISRGQQAPSGHVPFTPRAKKVGFPA